MQLNAALNSTLLYIYFKKWSVFFLFRISLKNSYNYDWSATNSFNYTSRVNSQRRNPKQLISNSIDSLSVFSFFQSHFLHQNNIQRKLSILHRSNIFFLHILSDTHTHQLLFKCWHNWILNVLRFMSASLLNLRHLHLTTRTRLLPAEWCRDFCQIVFATEKMKESWKHPCCVHLIVFPHFFLHVISKKCCAVYNIIMCCSWFQCFDWFSMLTRLF